MQITADNKRISTVTDDAILGFFGEYKFLSNFEPCNVDIDGRRFKSSEAAYMSFKTDNVVYKDEFAAMTDPSEAKKLGNLIPLRSDWDNYRVMAMFRAVRQKFFQNPGLAEKLLATGNKYLEETNNWKDAFWGNALQEDGSFKGLNMLGKVLMNVRSELRHAEPF